MNSGRVIQVHSALQPSTGHPYVNMGDQLVKVSAQLRPPLAP